MRPLLGLVHAGGMLDGREHFVLEEDRLPLPAARGRAIGGEIVQLHVEQQQFVAGLVGHLDPFAAGRAVELDVKADAKRQRRAAQVEDGVVTGPPAARRAPRSRRRARTAAPRDRAPRRS